MEDDIIMNEDRMPFDKPMTYEVITADEASCKAMMDFWLEMKNSMDWNDCHEPELQIIPCDDPLKGLKGHLVCMSFSHVNDPDSDDVQMQFSWRHADPIKRIVYINFEEHNPSEVMIKCVDDGWEKCDNPQRLLAGFLNYEKSECMYFPLSVVKGMNDEARMKYQQTFSNV